MQRANKHATPAKIIALRTIEGLLDYAILESAELGLPSVVCLLRMARLEVETTVLDEENTSLSNGDMCEISLR